MSSDVTERPTEPDLAALSEETVEMAMSSSYGIKAYTTDDGFAVAYEAPDGRDPYSEWDWVGVYQGSEVPPYDDLGDYINWNWVCPDDNCSDVGATVIPNADHSSGQKYTVAYFAWKWTVVATDTITAPQGL